MFSLLLDPATIMLIRQTNYRNATEMLTMPELSPQRRNTWNGQ